MPTIVVALILETFLAPATGILRIRPQAYLQTVLDDAADRSPALGAIVGRINASDVIVHVTCERFASSLLEGRTLWVSANRDARYLRVQIDCLLPRVRLVAILAHELQHVAEVAAARDVADERAFGRLFRRIGFSTCSSPATEQYETAGALAAGDRVLHEYAHGAVRRQARLDPDR